MNKYIFIGLGIFFSLLYIKLRFFSKKKDEYDLLYEELLHSDKYKVKGQYDN